MRTKWARFLRNADGSSLILVTLAFVAILAAVGLVVDGGKLYVVKTELKKTANAAALSGAQELTYTEAAVTNVVNEVLERHEETGSLVSTTVLMGDQVAVHLKKDVPLSFASLFGVSEIAVEVRSTAQLTIMGRASGAAPLGIDEAIPVVYGQEYKLKVDQTESDYGNFGILALGGSGSRTYEDNLKYGYQNELKLGDILNTETGNVAGKTREGVNARIDACPYPEGEWHHRDCERVILIPVYKEYLRDSNQLKKVIITGFSYFYITKPMAGSDKVITGMFIKRAGTGYAVPGAKDTGAYAIRLIE